MAEADMTNHPSGTASPDDELRRRFARVFAPLIAFAAPLAAYFMTMARGLVWGDGIELAAVCASLGIAHPTGYPTFTMLGHAFTWQPFGSAAWRVTLLCAISIAASCLIIYHLLMRLGAETWTTAFPREDSRAALALSGALAFGFCFGPWAHATLTEVYALELLILLSIVVAALAAAERPGARSLAVVAFLFGLGFTHHMLTLAAAPIVAWAAWEARRRRAPAKAFAIAAAAFVAGLLPLLYLPIRASMNPPLNWGDPATPTQLWWALTGGEFRQYRFLAESPGHPFTLDTYLTFAGGRLAEFARYMSGQIVRPAEPDNPAWAGLVIAALAFVGLGIWRLWANRKRLLVALASSAAIYFFFLFTYNIPDIHDYFLGFFGLAWAVAWIGAAELARWGAWEWNRVGQSDRAARAAWLLMAIPVAAFLFNYRAVDRSRDEAADVFASRLLSPVTPDNAILLTAGDSDIYCAWYLQEVEHHRRDVLVFGSNFVYYPWYNKYFEGRDLAGRKVRAPGGRATTDVAFVDLLARNVIDPNLGRFPIVTTLDIPALRARYDLKPLGGLIDRPDYEASILRGEFPGPPVLFEILPRGSAEKEKRK